MRNLLEKIKNVLSSLYNRLSPIKAFYKKHYDIINPIFVLTAICLIVAAALSLTNSLTVNKINEINLKNKNNEMAALIPAESYNEVTALPETADPSETIYEAKNGDTILGYIVTSTSKGYGGEISVMTAFTPDCTVKGISILNCEDETAGLGQNISKSDFLSRFTGLKSEATIVKNNADINSGEIKAWTGATISSKGVVNAVNSARESLTSYLNTLITNTTNQTAEQTITENGGSANAE